MCAQSYKVTQAGLELTTFQLLPSQGWDHTWYCHAWPSILIWSYNSNSIKHEEMENYCRRESHDFFSSAFLGECVLTVSCQETRPHVEVSDHRELGVLPCAQLSHGDLVSLPPTMERPERLTGLEPTQLQACSSLQGCASICS